LIFGSLIQQAAAGTINVAPAAALFFFASRSGSCAAGGSPFPISKAFSFVQKLQIGTASAGTLEFYREIPKLLPIIAVRAHQDAQRSEKILGAFTKSDFQVLTISCKYVIL